MATIGLDCNVILDGQGYWVEPDTFSLSRPRVRSAVSNRTAASGSAGAGERYVDLGPGKREWTFIVAAFQALRDFAGNPVTTTGQSYRDALHTSYQKVNTTLAFTDPNGSAWTVRFDHLVEDIENVRAQADGQLQYHMHITLVEA